MPCLFARHFDADTDLSTEQLPVLYRNDWLNTINGSKAGRSRLAA